VDFITDSEGVGEFVFTTSNPLGKAKEEPVPAKA
jgi:hypothetical protein